MSHLTRKSQSNVHEPLPSRLYHRKRKLIRQMTTARMEAVGREPLTIRNEGCAEHNRWLFECSSNIPNIPRAVTRYSSRSPGAFCSYMAGALSRNPAERFALSHEGVLFVVDFACSPLVGDRLIIPSFSNCHHAYNYDHAATRVR